MLQRNRRIGVDLRQCKELEATFIERMRLTRRDGHLENFYFDMDLRSD